MKIEYLSKTFAKKSLEVIFQAEAIIDDYLNQGYKLTLRQLYYQFVARGYLANTVANYKRLGSIISDARLAGLISWEAIEDRTRNLEEISTWRSPDSIIQACARSYRTDLWRRQPYRIEVWIEKEALSGVFDRVCDEEDLPFFACRGYVSQSEMWAAAQRFIHYERRGQDVILLHFGDHDPSGIDMTRDIVDRLSMFGSNVDVQRLALNMDQIEEWNPPPNPAKMTDARFEAYRNEFGEMSWELDALDPATLSQLVRNAMLEYRERTIWDEDVEEMEEERGLLQEASRRWTEVSAFLNDGLD